MSADVGLAGRSVAPGTGRRCRGAVGCGRSMAAALEWGRYRDSRVDGRPVPHAFLCGPLPFSFVEKEKTAPLGECGLLYETGRRMQHGPDTLSGRFRSRCNSVAVLVLQLIPGAAVLFFGYSLSTLLGEGCAQNGTATRRGRVTEAILMAFTPRRPRFGALSTPCGALFRKGRGEAPAGARR